MGKQIVPGSGMYSRCETLAKRFKEENVSWDYLKSQDTLMRYSEEFRRCVADMCGVDPDTGKPVAQEPEKTEEPEDAAVSAEIEDGPSDEELDAIEAEEEPEPEPEKPKRGRRKKTTKTEPDIELDEAEEAANETEAESEAEETEEVEMEDDDTLPWNLCHWCQQAEAVTAVYTYVQDNGNQQQRLARCEHLCHACADRYWAALREAQYAAMTPDETEE